MTDDAAKKDPKEVYDVTLTSVDKLSADEIATCIDVVADGGAVPRAAAKKGVPQAATLALVRHRDEIIGVGVIKGPNPQHARTVAREKASTRFGRRHLNSVTPRFARRTEASIYRHAFVGRFSQRASARFMQRRVTRR
jgi:hypothetical protein